MRPFSLRRLQLRRWLACIIHPVCVPLPLHTSFICPSSTLEIMAVAKQHVPIWTCLRMQRQNVNEDLLAYFKTYCQRMYKINKSIMQNPRHNPYRLDCQEMKIWPWVSVVTVHQHLKLHYKYSVTKINCAHVFLLLGSFSKQVDMKTVSKISNVIGNNEMGFMHLNVFLISCSICL